MSNANDLARLLCDLVDVLIPGDGRWPAASAVGVQGVLAMRLLELRGEEGIEEVERALLANGGPLALLDAAGRVAVVERFQQGHPALFTLVRNATTLAYYESPAVIRAIRELGQPYQAVPIHEGYALPPFDPDCDRPRHERGRWLRTEEVKRLDLSLLAGGEHGRG
jgi:hypothetical protein